MPKRYTDSDKWRKPWFRKLPAPYREFWIYLLDSCDQGGIWYVDKETAEYYIGSEIKIEDALVLFEKQVTVFDSGCRWLIKDFVEFQYGRLNQSIKFHSNIIEILKKHSLWDTLLHRVWDSTKAKAKDEAKAKDYSLAVRNFKKLKSHV